MVSNQRRPIPWDLLIVLGILGLTFYLAHIPHINYPYPVHGDEWVHWAYSEAMLHAGSASFTDPFGGVAILGLETNFETGFHLFLVMFRLVTDISWLSIFQYLPAVIFMITVLSVFIFARKEGFGWEAALFTCLLPTTVGVLGPALLVPVAIGLLFIPLSLYLAFNFKVWQCYLLLCLINIFLLLMHPPSAVIIFMITIPYILLNLRRNLKHSLGLILAIVIPCTAGLIWLSDTLIPIARNLFDAQTVDPSISLPPLVQKMGYLPIAFSFVGIVWLLIKGGKNNHGLIFGLLILVAMLLVFFRLHYGVTILYERGLVYLMLMLAITAGAGLARLRMIRIPIGHIGGLKFFFIRNTGAILCLASVVIILVTGIPNLQQNYYNRFIDDKDYQAFIWIRDNLGDKYDKAILDPWKATAFSAITQKSVYTRIHGSVKDSDVKAYDFLTSGCGDNSLLLEHGISIVYSQWDCDNTDLIKVAEGVYILGQADR
jgi:hypothetical protein